MNEDSGCFIIFLCVIGAIIWYVWLDDSKLRYEYQHDAEVTVENKPRDCDFLTAPLGRKNCSYKKEVSITLFGKDKKTGRPIVSYDDGENWYLNEGGPTDGSEVRIYWVQSED